MSIRRLFLFSLVAVAILLATGIQTTSLSSNDNTNNPVGLVAGRNVNMVSGITFPDGDPYLQRQNEPSIAVSTRNPLHLFAGANDYRSINIAMMDKLPGHEETNTAPAPDAWLGVFKSIDGGSTWTSTLLPGFYYMDTTPSGEPLSPLFGFSAAADPVVRAGPNGLFFYAGIVFNREDRGDSAVFVSRFIDNNNKENVDTTAYIDTQIQARGSAGQFIDKPWLAVDVPYQEAPSIPIPSPDPETDYQYVTRCNVYLAYSVFLGNPDLNIRTKVYFARSTDSGESWENPTKLTETQHISQGAVIAVDPSGNGHVWVAWRRFAHINNKGQVIQPDAIVVVKSEDGGATFTKPFVVAELAPWFPPSDNGVFDQPTTPESFRTNDYPTMAVDHYGTAYIAWTQRGLGPTPGVGEARIVMTASSDGINWSTPTQVISETEPVYPDPPGPPGHQLMPQLTYAAGKLTMLWYDHRWDVIQIFLPFIEDIYPNVRHTIDVRVAQAEILSYYPVFSPSIQVSKYPFLLFHDESADVFMAYQLFYNKPNLPLFSLGTRPFMGDYIGIAPSPMFLSPEDPNNSTDYWIYNTDSSVPTIYHAVWTDNRDVVHPDETPVLPSDTPDLIREWAQYNAPGEGCANGNRTGIRNQNIYTSRISEGILAGSPGNTKPLNMLRSFVVFVQNMTGVERTFDLEIIKPTGLEAYFWQEVGDPTGILEDVFVPPYSYVSKTILVEAYSSEYASIIINIYDAESGELVDYVTLNPDSTNPIISEPEGWDPESPHPRNDGETHTPHPRNYTIIDWNTEAFDQYDPYINTIIPQYDEAIANNDGVTPYSVEVDPESPHPRNPHGRNPHPRNPHGRNFLLNPHPRNEHITAIEDGSQMTDVVWTIENTGNTTTSYSINTFETPEDLPDGILAQLIVFKTYTTPAVDIWEADGCQLIEQEYQEMVVNLTTPHPRNPTTPHPRNLGELGDVSINVPPNELFYVLYRYYNPYQSPEQQEFHDEGKYEEAVPDIESDTPDTDGDDIVGPPPQLLVIPPQALPDAVFGDESYNEAIQAEGGTGFYGNWTVIDGFLPGGLSLELNSGVISSHAPLAAAGNYTFKVQVNDFDEVEDPGKTTPLQTAKKTLSITVKPPSPALISPAAGSVLDNGCDSAVENIVWDFDWSDVSGATKYHLYVKYAGAELSLIDDQEVTPSEYHYVDSGHIIEANRFNWRWKVRVLVNDKWSEWSAERSFDVEPLNTDCPPDTPPAVISFDPADDASGVGVNADLVITFDENVVADTGNIVIYKSDDTVFETIDVTSGKVTISDNVVTIDPDGTFESETGYYVKIGTACFKDIAENHYAGISNITSWNFTTVGDLIAYYPFNGNANDESGNSLNGAVSEATLTTDRSGNTNRAYNFDGDNDKIAVSDHSLLDITSQISLSAWIYPTETKTQVIIRKSSSITPPPPYGLALSETGDTIFNLSPTGQFTQLRKTGYELNKWSFIVGTYDGTTMKLYVNGNLEKTLPTSGSLNQNDGPLLIGTRLQLPADTFKGKLDDIRIYNRALSESEIEALYIGLIARYPFNGNTDDASGNGNHGTTYGGATFTEDRFGNANGAINFDGIDDYVELPNENNFDLTTWTMVMILKVQDYTKTKSVISKGDNSYGNYTLDIIQQDAPSPINIGKFGYAQAYGVGGNYSHLVTHDPVPIDQFFHIAVCFDDTSFKTFFNGQIDWSIGALPVPILNDAPVRFGLLNMGINSGHFKGQIDEIRIYNRVLSETEVNELYSTLEPSCIENAPDPWGGAHANIIPANQRWQSFLTNSSAIYKVDVDIRTLNSGYGDDTITMKILSSNDDVLTSVTQDVTDGFEGWLSFGIPAGLEVNPGETLKIQIEDTGKITFSWKYGSDSYPDGTASLSSEDFYFRINCR